MWHFENDPLTRVAATLLSRCSLIFPTFNWYFKPSKLSQLVSGETYLLTVTNLFTKPSTWGVGEKHTHSKLVNNQSITVTIDWIWLLQTFCILILTSVNKCKNGRVHSRVEQGGNYMNISDLKNQMTTFYDTIKIYFMLLYSYLHLITVYFDLFQRRNIC